MASWREGTPPSMRLKSEGFASSLSDPGGEFTLKTFCRAAGLDYQDIDLPTPVETFIAYGDAFQKRFAPQLDTRLAREIRQSGDGFEIELDDGARVNAQQCAIATGLTGFEHIPAALGGLSPQRCAHTAALSDYTKFARAKVLVVGAGASATNAAGELLRHGAEVTLVCRGPALRFFPGAAPRGWRDALLAPLSPIGPGWSKWAASYFPQAFRALPERARVKIVDSTLGPAPAWFVRQEIEGRIEVLAGREIAAARESATGLEVEFVDQANARSTRGFDYVIAGTGYKVDVERLPFLSPKLRSALARVGGAPKLSRAFESSIPGLYFVGVAAANGFGPALRFVCGADFASRRASFAIVAQRRGRASSPGGARIGLSGLDTSFRG